MSTKCVCDEHRVRTISVATFHIRPELMPVSATRYVIAVWQVVAVSRWSIFGRQHTAFAMDYRNGYNTALSLPNKTLYIESAMHLARRAPRNLGLQP
jgi:hypothetical protein